MISMWALLSEIMQPATALLVAGLVEGTGLPWPGIVVMASAGMAAGEDWRAVALLTLVFCTAYTLGSLIQYAVGRSLGPAALGWLAPGQRARLEGLISRYGTGAVCWARPLAIGNYVSIPAGMVKMNLVRFVLYTFLGAIPWAGTTLFGGWLLGDAFSMVQEQVARWMMPGFGLVAAAAGAALLLRLRNRKRSSESETVTDAGAEPS
jgi:membrane protein DedA with SNARE-associated domain